MPADGDQSPRAAIRDWLFHNGGSDRCNRGQDRTSKHHKNKQQPCKAAFEISGSPQQSTLLAAGCRSPQGTKTQPAEEGLLNSKPSYQPSSTHGANIADLLDLHAPFRVFGDCQVDPSRKRRQIISSSSSLEFAENHCSREAGHTAPAPTALDGLHEQIINRSDLLSQSEDSPKGLAVTSENPAKMYQKRSRHKTRGDKYNPKESRKAKKHVENDNGKKTRKRKRREKMGKTLMHDFTASNVAQERLTMKPAASLGLFRKGRASSPIRRKGYSAFSEAAFLNSHKRQPNIPDENPEGTRKQRKRGKAAETEAEISRYFTSKVPEVCWGSGDTEEKRKQPQTFASPGSEEQRRCGNVETSPILSPPIELPQRPFLGFGSSGPCISPVKLLPHNLSSFQERPLPKSRSFTSSTSYYTWSQSSIHSCSPARRCREKLAPSVDLEAAAPAHQQEQCIERSKDSITSVPPEAREGLDRIDDDVEEHVEVPLYCNPKQSRSGQCASNTEALEPSPPRASDHITDKIQTTNDCRTIEELQKNFSRANGVANANQSEPTNVEHDLPPCTSPERLVHCDAILSFDAALGALLHTFQADPSKEYEPITASEDQALSSRSPAHRHLDPDAVRPTRKDGEDAPHTIHENERGISTDSNRGSPLQDYCNRSPAPTAKSKFQRLSLLGQSAEHESIASTPATAFVSVENPRSFNGHSARDAPAYYLAPDQQLFEYSGGAWNAYESMYEKQNIDERWHDCSFDDNVWTSHGRTYEPKLGLQSEFHGQAFSNPEDLDGQQFLSHQLGPTEELSNLVEAGVQSYRSPQGAGAFGNCQPAHVEERFPRYHSMADMGSLTYHRASPVTEENPLSSFWKPNRLY